MQRSFVCNWRNAAKEKGRDMAATYENGIYREGGAGSLRHGIAFSGKSLAVAVDRRP